MIRMAGLLSAAAMLFVLTASVVLAQRVTVDWITPYSYMRGSVRGLPQSKYSDYKIVAYSQRKDGVWRIYPYAGQGEGISWSNISGGQWRLRSVPQSLFSQSIAVLLVSRKLPEKESVRNLNEIPHLAITILPTVELRSRNVYKLM